MNEAQEDFLRQMKTMTNILQQIKDTQDDQLQLAKEAYGLQEEVLHELYNLNGRHPG